jgi:hypothetical protein
VWSALVYEVRHYSLLSREEQQVENSNEFWANVSMVVVSPVAITAGVAKGTLDASTNNGPFREGFGTAAGPIMRAAKEFGNEHGTTMTKGMVTGAAGALGARILRTGLRHLRI